MLWGSCSFGQGEKGTSVSGHSWSHHECIQLTSGYKVATMYLTLVSVRGTKVRGYGLHVQQYDANRRETQSNSCLARKTLVEVLWEMMTCIWRKRLDKRAELLNLRYSTFGKFCFVLFCFSDEIPMFINWLLNLRQRGSSPPFDLPYLLLKTHQLFFQNPMNCSSILIS